MRTPRPQKPVPAEGPFPICPKCGIGVHFLGSKDGLPSHYCRPKAGTR